MGVATVAAPGLAQFASALEVPLGLRPPPALQDRLPASDEPALAALAKRLCDDAYSRMAPWRRKWGLTENWTYGNFQTWNYKTGRLQDKPGEQFASLGVHLNVMRPTVNTWVSKLLSAKPQPIILPGSTDAEVIDAARTAQRIASEWQWHVQGMEQRRGEFLQILEIKGTSIFKLIWNPRGGKPLGMTPRLKRDAEGNPQYQMQLDPFSGEQVPVLDENNAPQFEVERDIFERPIMDEAFTGCNELVVIDPEDLLVDPVATVAHEAMWMAHISEQHVAHIGNTYRDENGEPIRVQPDGQFRDTSSTWAINPTSPARIQDFRSSATVREVWIRKGKYPWGNKPGEVIDLKRDYMIVECNGKTLAHGPNIYEHGRFPFIVAVLPKPKRQFWGETRLNDVRGLQATVLKTAKIWTDSNDLCAAPRITFGAGAKIKDADRTNKPGAWIEVASMARSEDFPRFLEGASVSSGLVRWLDDLFVKWLPFVSGNHLGGMAGGAPPNVEAAAAFIQLEKVDADQLTPDSLAYGIALQEWLEMTMLNCKQFMTIPELVEVAGKNREPEVVAFSSDSIKDSFIYQILPSSVIPQSGAAKFQKTITLFMQRDEMGRPLLSARDVKRRLGEEPNEERTTDEIQTDAAKRDIYDAKTKGRFETPDVVLNFVNPEIYLEEYGRYLLENRQSDNPQAYGLILNRAIELYMFTQQKTMAGQAPQPSAPPAEPGAEEQSSVAASGRPDQPLPSDPGIPAEEGQMPQEMQ